MTGPDEYSAVADNNVYTNLMAQRNLRLAADAVRRHPDRAAELHVDPEETAAWRDAAEAMLIPFDERLGVHPQAEGFTEHEPWDFEAHRPGQYPLLSHFPYFDLYRKQVVKQADLVLAMHLRGDAFSAQEKARNFAYYEALTVRDSSLSACTQAVIAAEVGQLELAYDYFAEAALIDLGNLEHNTRDGLHIASLAGTWIVAVAGFGGMRDHDGVLSFAPRLPQRLTGLTFGVCFRGRRLRVEVTHRQARYSLLQGSQLDLTPPRPRDHGDRRPADVLSHPCARREKNARRNPMAAVPHPDAPCQPAVASRRLDARRHRSVLWLAARPVSQVAEHHGRRAGRGSAEEMTDVGPESTVAGLGEQELVVLRHVGEHWGRVLAGRRASLRGLPIDPALHRFPR